MSTSPANSIPDEWKDEPRIKLGKQEWAVPPMTARVIIEFIKITSGLRVSADAKSLSSDDLEKLYLAVHCGLRRAYPNVSFDEFMEMPINPNDLIGAFPIIGAAAGLEVSKVGEAQAVAQPDSNSSTDGTTL